MANSLMYQEDYFVVLQSDQPEKILNPQELLDLLQKILQSWSGPLPKELLKFESLTEKALFLRDNFCEWNPEPGHYLQWYVVRLEK